MVKFQAVIRSDPSRLADRIKLTTREARQIAGPVRDLFDDAVSAQLATAGARGAATHGTWSPLSPDYARWKASRFPGAPVLELTGRLKALTKIRLGPVTSSPTETTVSLQVVFPTRAPRPASSAAKYAGYRYGLSHQDPLGQGRPDLPKRKIAAPIPSDLIESARLFARRIREKWGS